MLDEATVSIPATALGSITDMRQRVIETLAHYNAAKEDAAAKKKTYEAARETFEREFDRLIAKTKGDDLPLFNQSELIERAQKDPVVTKLVDRLLHEANANVNLMIVAGYTDDERAQASAWLDECAKIRQAHADALIADPNATMPALPEPPPFLAPQPEAAAETAEELSWLCERLKEHNIELLPLRAMVVYTLEQRNDLRAWLKACDAVKAEKGEALTFDDLPAAPACLLGQRGENEVAAETSETAEASADNEVASEAPTGDEIAAFEERIGQPAPALSPDDVEPGQDHETAEE